MFSSIDQSQSVKNISGTSSLEKINDLISKTINR